MMYRKRRIHTTAIFFNLIPFARRSIFAIGLGLFTFKGRSFIYFISITVVIYLITMIISGLRWYRFTYRITDDELQIEYGLFIRKQRYISKNRIQSIDLTSSVVHRMLKLVRVDIETASSGSNAEALLSAVKVREGEKLREELRTKTTIYEETEVMGRVNPRYKISFKRLFLAGSTSGSIGVILAIGLFAFSELEQFVPQQFYDNAIAWLIGLSIVIILSILMIVLLVLWMLGIAGTIIKYGNFTIIKKEEELFITRGLLEKKELTIPLKRIQAIRIEESIIRQPFGYVTVHAEVAGGSMDNRDGIPVLFPILKASEVDGFLHSLLPDYGPVTTERTHIPKRSRKLYLIRAIFPVLLLSKVVGYFLTEFSWILIFLFVTSIFIGSLRHHDGGYAIEGKKLTVIYRRAFHKMTVMVYHNRIQSIEKKQHIIQARNNVATLKFSIIGMFGRGTHVVLKDLAEEDLEQIADWYSYLSIK